ncbi:hypothetical protein [Gimesia panareensis]|uniref:hypothetical protein n=1 Tax=Gimesia panareensis TaxID=2527978 RepID=UPI0011A96CAE|nr:hypothetical protein [Gimesia panareensis]
MDWSGSSSTGDGFVAVRDCGGFGAGVGRWWDSHPVQRPTQISQRRLKLDKSGKRFRGMRIRRCQRKERIETSACLLLVVPDPYLNASLFWDSGPGEIYLHPRKVFYNPAQRTN